MGPNAGRDYTFNVPSRPLLVGPAFAILSEP